MEDENLEANEDSDMTEESMGEAKEVPQKIAPKKVEENSESDESIDSDESEESDEESDSEVD